MRIVFALNLVAIDETIFTDIAGNKEATGVFIAFYYELTFDNIWSESWRWNEIFEAKLADDI